MILWVNIRIHYIVMIVCVSAVLGVCVSVVPGLRGEGGGSGNALGRERPCGRHGNTASGTAGCATAAHTHHQPPQGMGTLGMEAWKNGYMGGSVVVPYFSEWFWSKS